MEQENTCHCLKRTMGILSIVYLLLGAFYSLPGWSTWIQDKLNWVTLKLLGNQPAGFTDHAMYQAGAFVLILVLLYLAATSYLNPEAAGDKVKSLVIINLAYSISGLLFFIFSRNRVAHDLFVFIVFGALGLWAQRANRPHPAA